jgi:hypothetical protein
MCRDPLLLTSTLYLRSASLLTIHWRGGQHSQLRVRKPKFGEHGCRTSDEALAVMRSMASRWSDEDIAASLNRMGMPTGQGKTWTAHRVSSVRRVNGIHAYRSAEKNGEWLTMSEAASALGVTRPSQQPAALSASGRFALGRSRQAGRPRSPPPSAPNSPPRLPCSSVQRRRRSGPVITSTVAIALSLAPVQAPEPTQPDQLRDGKTAFGGGLLRSPSPS